MVDICELGEENSCLFRLVYVYRLGNLGVKIVHKELKSHNKN